MLCKTIVIFKIKYTAEKNSHVLIQCTYTINRYTDYLKKKNEYRYRQEIFFVTYAIHQ